MRVKNFLQSLQQALLRYWQSPLLRFPLMIVVIMQLTKLVAAIPSPLSVELQIGLAGGFAIFLCGLLYNTLNWRRAHYLSPRLLLNLSGFLWLWASGLLWQLATDALLNGLDSYFFWPSVLGHSLSGWLLCAFLPLLLAIWLMAVSYFFVRKPDEKTLTAALRGLQKCWLWPLSRQQRSHYQWFLAWRWQVLGLQLQRQWAGLNIRRWLGGQRWAWVLIAGACSLWLLIWIEHGLTDITSIQGLLHDLFFGTQKPTGDSRSYTLLLGTFISAPVLYLLWKYRDTNQLWLIENNRKDINLKDFQQLARWAAGEHLPEIAVEYTPTAKDTSPITGQLPVSGTGVAQEHLAKISQSLPPQASADHVPSRREGAEALQVAAVYQIDAFLAGEFGQHFQRPAFHLLCALWRALTQEAAQQARQQMQNQFQAVLDEYQLGPKNLKRAYTLHKALRQQSEELVRYVRAPLSATLGQALHGVLWTHGGERLRAHPHDLAGACWAGFNNQNPVLSQQPSLVVAGLNLAGADFSGTDLRRVHFEGADLRGAHFEGADLRGAHFEGADLRSTHFESADMRRAHLEGTNLGNARLEGADLSGVHFEGSDMRRAHLEGTNLGNARLEGADLRDAHLEGSDLSGAHLKNANLNSTHLEGAYLYKAYLEGANLSRANLEDANLDRVYLEGADLSNAHLEGADLSGAHLEGVYLRNAYLERTDLRGSNLKKAKLINVTLDIHTQFEHCYIDAETRVEIWISTKSPWEPHRPVLDQERTDALLQQMRKQGWPG